MAKKFAIATKFTGTDNLTGINKAIASSFGALTRSAMKTNRAIKAIGTGSKKMGQSLRSASLVGAVGLTLALGPIIAFSDQINELEAVSRASEEQLASMSDQAKELGKSTRFSAAQAASAQTFLARAGFKTNEILSATPAVLNLAAASNMELARTADIASNIMGAYGIEASKMSEVSDILAATTSSANVDLEQLADSLKFAGPIAKKAGLNLQDTAAAIGLLGNVGIQGSLAGTALRRMLTSLAAPSAKASEILSDLGVKTKDSVGNLRALPDVLADVAKGLQTLPEASRIEALKEIFGLQGISAGAELVSQANLGNLQKLGEALTDVKGRAKEMADTMNKGPGGALRKLISASEGLAIAIGDSGLASAFTQIVDKVTLFVGQMSQSEKSTLGNVAVMLALLAVASPILIAFGSILTIVATLGSAFLFMGGIISTAIIPAIISFAGFISGIVLPAISSLIIGFITLAPLNPFLAIVIAVAAVIAIFAALMFVWKKIAPLIGTGITKIIAFFQPLIDIVGGLFSGVGKIFSLFGKTLGITTEEKTEKPKKQPIETSLTGDKKTSVDEPILKSVLGAVTLTPDKKTAAVEPKAAATQITNNLKEPLLKVVPALTNLAEDKITGAAQQKIAPQFVNFVQTDKSPSSKDDTQIGQFQSIPAQRAANQVNAQASANARVEFIGTPRTGVRMSDENGSEIDPELGITAAAGF